MNKEEILAKSRQENGNKDIAELETIYRANNIAMRVGLLVCCIIAVLASVFTERPNYSVWAIYFAMLGTMFLVKYLHLRRRHELLLTVLFYLSFLLFFVFYILSVTGVL